MEQEMAKVDENGGFDGHKYWSNYAVANWKLNTLGVDGVTQRTGTSLPAVLRERKLKVGGGRKFTSTLVERTEDSQFWRGGGVGRRSVRMTPRS